ncbi:MAG: mannose-1-phosphate guanylyltransferase/mannose-6-phosphate isomerase [Burkholderiaceae bacterium]
MTIIPVILSGGSGTRLWPVSREAYPKPFIRLANGPSLLQRVLGRCAPLCEDSIYIVTNEAYGFKTREEATGVAGLGAKNVHQVLEPAGRNTAPAIGLAALNATENGEDPILLVLPADHLIPDEAAFQASARQAAQIAETGKIVLFGIQPTAPETGFGYIELGQEDRDGSHAVRRFVEKPDLDRATEFLAAGNFVWNSGMFCFKASAIIAALDEYSPELMKAVREVWTAGRKASPTGESEVRFDPKAFMTMPDISIDYAVMEKATNIALVKAGFHWSDIGSWKAVAEQLPADADGNTSVGEHMLVDARNTHVQSDSRLIAAVGVENLLIVDTPDAVLVASKDASQQVKEVVAKLKNTGHSAATLHRTVARPWGTYTVLHEGPRFKMKEIVVKPEQTLSLQMHHHRAEHWIVISGTAKVSCDDETRMVYGNESTYIPIGAKHRLENPGKVDLMLIEVQCGDYVGEDDIVRFDDRYGRVEAKSN